jgi:putative chitobiose transport system permease protein
LLNALLAGVGIKGPSWLADSSGILPWLGQPSVALFSIAAVTVWKASAYYMVIYLAGLQSIPKDLEEAARVDGAGWWNVVRHITIPAIHPYTIVVAIIATIGALRTFGEVYVMTGGGPFNRTNVLSYYIYILGFKYLDIGYACAVSLILLLIILCCSIVNFKLVGRGASIYE